MCWDSWLRRKLFEQRISLNWRHFKPLHSFLLTTERRGGDDFPAFEASFKSFDAGFKAGFNYFEAGFPQLQAQERARKSGEKLLQADFAAAREASFEARKNARKKAGWSSKSS